MSAAKAKRTLLAIEIPRDELACRIAEKACQFHRPIGLSPDEALDQLRGVSPETVASFYQMADVAVAYVHECINAAVQPS